jgi:membrane protein YdbS with pleckstrin-like domain
MREQGTWFGADAVRQLYRLYAVALLLVTAAIPVGVTLFTAPVVGGGLLVAALVVGGFLWWWAGAYDETVGYRLGDEELEYRGGVWFRSRKTVPYARITNVETKQGPVSRRFGVGSVAIQTAGQGAQSTAELTIRAIEDYEEVKDQVLDAVRVDRGEDGTGERRPRGDAAATGGEAADPLLAEVRAIRELLAERREGE